MTPKELLHHPYGVIEVNTPEDEMRILMELFNEEATEETLTRYTYTGAIESEGNG